MLSFTSPTLTAVGGQNKYSKMQMQIKIIL